MRCPFCGHEESQVKDSRPTEDNTAIRRRRFCPGCGARFTTFERVQLRELTIIKKNGARTPFDRDKLARSIMVATRKRPVDPERVERMINGLVRRLESMGEPEIKSDPVLAQFVNIGENARSYPLPSPVWADIAANDIVDAVQKALLAPDKTEDIFRDLDARLTKKLRDI